MDPRIVHDALAQAVCGVSIGLLAVHEAVLQWRMRGTMTAKSDRGTQLLSGLGIGAALVVGTRAWKWVPDLSLSNGGWWPIAAGLVVFWAGFALRWWAVHTLGRFHQLTVVVQADHSVVDSGPYRLLRHPSYTGILLIMIGVGLAYDNALGAAGAGLVAFLGLLPRILVEERALADGLGQPYRDFARTHRRLIPGVW
jgi:protein-S-isoprenylcysteine O-methyltransferase Ste14